MLDRRHFQNIAFNISGMVLPMLVGLLVVPDLIHKLGTDRFGVLSISWVLVGYLGLLDLGLARGLTQLLAKQTAANIAPEIRASFARHVRRWMLGLGSGWVLLMLVLTPWITHTGLQMPVGLRSEATAGWFCIALSVPLFMWAASSIGVLEAYGRFAAVNAVRIPMGIATFLVPWGIAHWTSHLGIVLGGLLCVRLAAAVAFATLSQRHFSGGNIVLDSSTLREVLAFGSWLTVSNLVGPVLAYFDRFAIGALLSMTAVTYYTVPFDVLSRLPSIPVAMMGVFFPMLTQAHGLDRKNSAQMSYMVLAANQLLIGFWVPGLIVCGLLGKSLLTWWVGAEIAQESYSVWAWISVGVLINGFAHIPYTLLHSTGRTDLTAKFHIAELIPYLLALWWALLNFGIVGAAAVWTLRVAFDTALLYAAVVRLFPTLRLACVTASAWTAGAAAVLTLGLYEVSRGPASLISHPLLIVLTAILWSGYQLKKLLKNRL